jgi:hypothetical protein
MRNLIGTTPPGAFLAAVFSASVVLPCPAHPASAKPLGWSYPYSGRSGIDCRQVTEKAISARSEGDVINSTGEVVAYKDRGVNARLTTSTTGVRWPAPNTAERFEATFASDG